jgi:hypothetical protein
MVIENLPQKARNELFEFYQYLLYKYDCRAKYVEKEYDVTSDPLYRIGEDEDAGEEPKENFSENIDQYLYGNGDYPK